MILPAHEDGAIQPPQQTNFPTTNSEFLAAIFKNLTEPHRPFVAGFAGKPAPESPWGGKAWSAARSATYNPALNWYFTLATYAPADDGYRRRDKDCTAVWGLMLDDLGTKALPLTRLDACPPSYVIETSAGNYQAGYLFEEPVTDFDSIKKLNQSTVDAGLCDSGAKAPTSRFGRLPFASNCKTSPAFACKLTQWHPERRYTVAQVVEGLDLAPPKTRTPSPSPDNASSSGRGSIGTGREAKDLAFAQAIDALAHYRGDWTKDLDEACESIELTCTRSPGSELARAVALLRKGAEKSDDDFLILCEAFRRGVGTVEDGADLLLALAGTGVRDKVKNREGYRKDTSGEAARVVLAELKGKTFNRLGFRKWRNLPDSGKSGTPAPIPEGLAVALEDSGGVLAHNKRGDIIPAPANVKTILINDPRTRGLMAFNESTQEVERTGSWAVFDPHAATKPGNLQDIDISFVQAWLLLVMGLNLDKSDACEGIEMAARANMRDPMRDSLMALKWDGVPRVSTWLRDFAMIDNRDCAEYVSEAGICFLVGAVARALNPGCQFDTVLTVEGPGGSGKSTLFQILADAVGPDLFTDSVHDVTNPVHLVECTEGKFIVEIAELAGFRRAADVEAFKKAMTARRDKVRKPYMRKPVELPRRFVFAATTNSDQYIADPSGAAARRFHPVRTRATEQNPIDRNALAAAAPLLWAEAVHMWKAGQKIHIDPNSVAGKQWAVQRGDRQEDLPFEEEATKLVMGIAAGTVPGYWLGGRDGRGGITANDAAIAMGLDSEKVREGKYAERVAKTLKAKGFIRLPGSNGVRRWHMPPGLFQEASRMNAERAKETEL